ncbi:TetR/AcrR family transcriptional regulator [Kitasatospora sp. NPDC094015]|uniref:TetR/AcrR family transcriptional regulator n=1 Tax=Kitasatospora sp. NPDC094015 TaxID=3155205 RepID=UPI00331BE3CE
MNPTPRTERVRKSPEQVRTAVHQAVLDLMAAPDGAEPTIPAIAQRAGVNHTSIYRRWGSREALLADVVTTHLERTAPLSDTGSLRGDLTAWARAGVDGIRRPEGRVLVRAVALSMPSGADTWTERARHFGRRMRSIESIRERATARGEHPPSLEDILDQIVAPFHVRAAFGIEPPDTGYPELLVSRLLGTPDTPEAG